MDFIPSRSLRALNRVCSVGIRRTTNEPQNYTRSADTPPNPCTGQGTHNFSRVPWVDLLERRHERRLSDLSRHAAKPEAACPGKVPLQPPPYRLVCGLPFCASLRDPPRRARHRYPAHCLALFNQSRRALKKRLGSPFVV